jgi:hypothetical protein
MVPTLCRIDMLPLPLRTSFLGLVECTGSGAGAAGRFVVAAMARLTRVTQGKRFITL